VSGVLIAGRELEGGLTEWWLKVAGQVEDKERGEAKASE
jgi:hypothetical protein